MRRTATAILVVVAMVAAYLLGWRASSHRSPLDEAAASILRRSAKPLDASLLERAAVEGMLRASGDRWSSFYNAKQFSFYSEALAGRFTGVGIWLRAAAAGGAEVASVQPGSPAAASGVQGGDAIVGVDSTDLSNASVPTVAAALRGTPGSTLSLRVVRSGVEHVFTMPRNQVESTDVSASRFKDGVLLIRITAFTAGVGDQVAKTLRNSPHRGGVVLDLRDNPGGLVEEAVAVAGIFLDGGVVVSYERRGEDTRVLEAPPGADEHDPLVVLVNRQSASAAEVVAGALQDRNRAVIIGSRTYGKGSVQESQTLHDGSSILLTVGRYRTPTGRYLEGMGVSPDVLASDSDALAEGLAILKSLLRVSSRGGKR